MNGEIKERFGNPICPKCESDNTEIIEDGAWCHDCDKSFEYRGPAWKQRND